MLAIHSPDGRRLARENCPTLDAAIGVVGQIVAAEARWHADQAELPTRLLRERARDWAEQAAMTRWDVVAQGIQSLWGGNDT